MKRLLLLMACAAAAACSADWRDTSLPPQKRAELLTAEMTLDEKIGQLTSPYGWEMYERHGDSVRLTDAFREAVQNGHIGMLWGTFRADPWTQKDLRTGLTPQLAARLANRMQRYAVQHSRLGIPLFLAEEAPHGHMAIGATTFPTAPGQASTWNPELIERMGKVIAAEIRLQGGHICYGPVLDIVRDPRWSRTEESYGEDCYLTARIGEAYVRGTGSGDLSQSRHALSTLKHFIAYGASEGGQNGGSNLLGERELRETYLPPFEAAVKAGARSVMTAYNSVDGIPCTANRRMLTDILRGEWGFDGFVVSDLLSIEGLHETHGVAGSVREAAVQALRAGVDADLKGGAFASLREAAEAGDVAEAEIDRAVERVLALKFEMGLFENPYIDEAAAAEVGCAAHSELALEAARQSVTLLENRSGTLPLDPRRLRRVAVIGPNADNIYNQLGDYTAQQTAANTVRDGLEKLLGRDRVVYSRGCTVRGGDRSEIAAAVSAARGTDAAVVVIGGSSARDFDTEFLQTGAAKAAHDEVRRRFRPSDARAARRTGRAAAAHKGDGNAAYRGLHRRPSARPAQGLRTGRRPADGVVSGRTGRRRRRRDDPRTQQSRGPSAHHHSPRRRANSRLLQQKTPCEPRLHRSHGRAALSVRLRAELLDIRIRQPRSAAERRQRPRSQLPHTQHLGPRRRRSRTALHLGHGRLDGTPAQTARRLPAHPARTGRTAAGKLYARRRSAGAYRPAGPPRGGKGRLRHRRRLVVARYPPANNRNTRITS